MTKPFAINERVISSFKPTYLMVKEHSITGLRYLCKTTTANPLGYKGSGKYWKNHTMEHGRQYIKTIWYKLFTDIDDLMEFALFVSEEYDIVNSLDKNGKKLWANLKAENGCDGGVHGDSSPMKGKKHSDENKTKMANFGAKNGMFNKKHSAKSIEKIKKNRPDQSGTKNPFYGKTHKEESKRYGKENNMYGVCRGMHPNAKRVHTPLGWFECLLDAADAHQVSDTTLRNRIYYTKSKYLEYYYEENNNE